MRMASLMKPFRFPTYSRSSEGLDRNSSYSLADTGGYVNAVRGDKCMR